MKENNVQDINNQANELFEKVAQQMGSENGDSLIQTISENLDSASRADQMEGRNLARNLIQNLTPLLFDQYVREIEYSSWYGKFVSRFFYKIVENGNGSQVSQPLPVGPVNHTQPMQLNNFVPNLQSPKFIEQEQINFYSSTSTSDSLTFSAEGFCSEIELTIPEAVYLPFFKSGNPEKYFAQLRKQIEETTILVIYDNLAKKFSTSFKPQKQISGSATNAFECWSKEILPAISEMMIPNSAYNYDRNSKYFSAVKKENIHLLMSTKTWTNLKSNIMSQLYRVDYFKNGVLEDENVETLGFTLNLGNGTQAITVTTNQYLNDNTVIVYEPEVLKWIRQYQATASQFFARNHTLYYHHYEVLAAKFMPWGKCFKYTNSNLNTNPNGGN